MPTSSGVPPGPADPVAKLVDHTKFWLQASESVDGLGSLVKYKNEESPLSLKVSRVSQLDAELLDRELCDILKAKLFKGMAYFKVSPLMSNERNIFTFDVWERTWAIDLLCSHKNENKTPCSDENLCEVTIILAHKLI